MNKFNISIHPELLKRLEYPENKKNDLFFDSIGIAILNIEKQKNIKYNLSDAIEKKQYFQKYLYTINEIYLSFNSFLVKKYIRANRCAENPIDSDWEKIYQKTRGKNNIDYLLSFFFKKDNENHFLLEYIHKFYVYENLFRNQICHGWMDAFYDLFNSEIELSMILNYYTTKPEDRPVIVKTPLSPNLNQIRDEAKKNENIFLLNSIEDYKIKIKKYRPIYSEEFPNKKINELILDCKIQNKEIDDVLIVHYKNYIKTI